MLHILEHLIIVLLLLLKDWIIGILLRVGAWGFHLLGEYIPMSPMEDALFNYLHFAGAIVSYVIFFALFISDIWNLYKKDMR